MFSYNSLGKSYSTSQVTVRQDLSGQAVAKLGQMSSQSSSGLVVQHSCSPLYKNVHLDLALP